MATDTDYSVTAAVRALHAALGRAPTLAQIADELSDTPKSTIATAVRRMSKDGRLERIENGARPRYRVPEGTALLPAHRAVIRRKYGNADAAEIFTAFYALATAHIHAAVRIMLDPSDGEQVFSELADITDQQVERLSTLRGDLHGWHLSAIGLSRLDRIVATTLERGEDATDRVESVKHLAEQIREAMDEQRG